VEAFKEAVDKFVNGLQCTQALAVEVVIVLNVLFGLVG
jgi:hypothetical protein